MSKKLFLTSYFAAVAQLLPRFYGGSLKDKRVVFIPTASTVEEVTFYIDKDKKALCELGLEIDELDVARASYSETERLLSDADVIFVDGGNTFFLLQELKRSGADKLIIEHINRGGLYIGASAGSMVLCPNVEYGAMMDKPEVATELNGDFSALAVVDFYLVPHYTNFPFKKSVEKIIQKYANEIDLRPITNNQVIAVDGDIVETLSVD